MSEDSATDSSPISNSSSESGIKNRFRDVLDKQERLGSGGYGTVYKCFHTLDGKNYAVKRIKLKNKKELDWCLREVQALSCLEYKHVVRYYQSWTDLSAAGFSSSDESQSDIGSQEEDSQDALFLFIQMEFCTSTLESRLKDKPTSNHQALVYLHDLLLGLHYVHTSGYLHRDLSKKNIFFGQDDTIKIGDFGLAKQLTGPADSRSCSQSPHSTNIGIGLHRAPELLKNEPYTQESDLYAAGIVFLEMLLPPMDTEHEKIDTIDSIKKGMYPEDWQNKYKFEISVLKKLLAESPHDRPKASDLIRLISKQMKGNPDARE